MPHLKRVVITVADHSPALASLWKQCVGTLESELSEQQLNMWIRPLQAVEAGDGVVNDVDALVDTHLQRLAHRVDGLLRRLDADRGPIVGGIQDAKTPT